MSKRSELFARGLFVLLPLVVLALAGTTLFVWRDFWEEAARRFSPGCISRRWLGIFCPGCGGTRAFCALMRGEFLAVLKYNCWWLPTAFVLLEEYCDWALRRLFPQKEFPAWSRFRTKVLLFYTIFTIGYMLVRNIGRF